MPLAVTCLNFVLLFIFIVVSLSFAFIYNRLYPEPLWTANKDKGFNHRPTLYDGPLDRGLHTLQNQRRHVNDTQHVEISDDSDSDLDAPPRRGGRLLCTQLKFPSKQTRFRLKTPPDPHMDRIAQSLREPWERGLQHVTVPSFPRLRPCMEPPARIPQPLVEPREGSEQPQRGWKPPALDCGSHLHPTTPAHRPAYRRRPFGSLDDELDHNDKDDDHDDYDDHDYIDDGETDNSDSIWESHSSKKRRPLLDKALLTCLTGPSTTKPKLPDILPNGSQHWRTSIPWLRLPLMPILLQVLNTSRLFQQ
ncbi:hypothetical protein K443DRAFT_319017 [Laccaria amethystina LaAM-08-1]|uniref:Unplaced genomic scaffold K443scaffold_21, whole genome shotgun sequence n=1 Tax=Laccaria amethystina LaAM-08-1 TaxID=1095629 RepID=A0A0C9YCX7_9AGAR|nr:hypothetical protein K443DRAFT_319017 [Laccaria amethystina LaAM-08-1]